MMLKSATILLVDDSLVSRQMLAFTLIEMGFKNVLQADSAENALKLLKNEDVDAIITDLNMDGISGMEMIKALRGVSRFKGKPIFLLTGEDTPQIKQDARSAGATLILNKTDDVKKLKRVLSHYLNR